MTKQYVFMDETSREEWQRQSDAFKEDSYYKVRLNICKN